MSMNLHLTEGIDGKKVDVIQTPTHITYLIMSQRGDDGPDGGMEGVRFRYIRYLKYLWQDAFNQQDSGASYYKELIQKAESVKDPDFYVM